MKVGLLWFDDSDRDLHKKVLGAIGCYKKKCGISPNVCYVHPSALVDNGNVQVDGVRVEGKSTVLREHFWVGVEKGPSSDD